MINNYTAWGLTYSIFSLVIMRVENDDVVKKMKKKNLVSDTSQTPKFSGSHWAPGFPVATEKNRFPFPTAAAPRSQCHELMVCGSQVKWITKYTNHTSTVTSMQNGSKWCGNVWKNLSEKRRVQVEVGIDQAASLLLVQPYKRFQPSCRFPNCFGTFDVTRLCTGIQLSVETSKVALVRQACSDGILAVCDGFGYL